MFWFFSGYVAGSWPPNYFNSVTVLRYSPNRYRGQAGSRISSTSLQETVCAISTVQLCSSITGQRILCVPKLSMEILLLAQFGSYKKCSEKRVTLLLNFYGTSLSIFLADTGLCALALCISNLKSQPVYSFVYFSVSTFWNWEGASEASN